MGEMTVFAKTGRLANTVMVIGFAVFNFLGPRRHLFLPRLDAPNGTPPHENPDQELYQDVEISPKSIVLDVVSFADIFLGLDQDGADSILKVDDVVDSRASFLSAVAISLGGNQTEGGAGFDTELAGAMLRSASSLVDESSSKTLEAVSFAVNSVIGSIVSSRKLPDSGEEDPGANTSVSDEQFAIAVTLVEDIALKAADTEGGLEEAAASELLSAIGTVMGAVSEEEDTESVNSGGSDDNDLPLSKSEEVEERMVGSVWAVINAVERSQASSMNQVPGDLGY